ncbi:MAG: hsp [Myxococcaceae bacterium]|nr:hsp [Myxococcaceae bacterium]
MLSIWDSFADLPRIQREFERSFTGSRNRVAEFAPAVDVQEDSESVSLSAELPGVKREDIEIQLDGNVLTLRGERKLEQREEQGRRFHRVERSYGTFARQFHLPTNIDSTQIEAQLTDGVLTVRLPKKQEQKPRKIEVRTGAAPSPSVVS